VRGRALAEHLIALETPEATPSPVQPLVDREILLRRIDALATRFDEVDATSATERDSMAAITARSLSGKLIKAREEYETLLIRSEQLNVESLSLLGGRDIVAGEVRNALRESEVLLEYLVTPDRLLVFVVTRTETRFVEAPVTADDLFARVRLALGLLAKSGSSVQATDGVMRELHDALLPPAVRSAMPHGTRRLLVVPHSILNYVPYAALRNPATGRYLVEDFDVVRLPSAAALPALRKARSDADMRGALVRRAVMLAPFPKQLPGTRREAEAGARAIAGAQTHIGQQADEPTLRAALRAEGVVHVATHGVMNARNPMFSRIELSRGPAGGASDDGRLEVHEVLRLRVRSPLIFLSGCETAIGPAAATHWSRGEDYATLAQAFLYAGARDVIATLWKIEDNGAAKLAAGFYGHLGKSSPSDALARTQREMIRDSRFSAPYYWAAYTISGEGLSLPEMQNAQAASVQLK
jgi:CHAT domain-containing protein